MSLELAALNVINVWKMDKDDIYKDIDRAIELLDGELQKRVEKLKNTISVMEHVNFVRGVQTNVIVQGGPNTGNSRPDCKPGCNSGGSPFERCDCL